MISVCMATYNGEKYLKEQVDSILEQLGPEDELVVSDDGSSDRTVEILHSYHDNRIRVVENKGRKGVTGNFENAIRESKGEYIFLSDQDDVWEPHKVEESLKYLLTYDCVLHDAQIVDESLRNKNKTLFSELILKKGILSNLIRNRFTGCCMAFRREVLRYVLPIPQTGKFYHDNWIGLMVLTKGKVCYLEKTLIKFRRHSDNNSSAATKSQHSLSDKIGIRLSLGYNIIKNIGRK